ncbi:SDR family oxidoreductase [Puniceicoccus vermicola]|uniref:SDR family oxidoreductase n=1 Tax=Puniceicoccus vermicola TaxID=388746 RepID=A0A7X1E545_9BACT|nr:SDR family oxidoreductase [Puniceicoccus vermicola]MBC2602749.1 SDR family oxidoreductase [Puniceicoccus vermicola]
MKNEKLIAIVTGGSGGFGAGMAEALSQVGHIVYITGRNEKKLTEAAERVGAIPVVSDATNPADWDRVVTKVMEDQGRIDVLVNNAGAGGRIAPLEEQTDEEIAHSISLNLTSAIFGCRRIGAIMKRQGSGCIINVSSVCAKYSWPGWSVYSAAKAGVERLGKGLYAELREFGVRVTTLTPSWGATEFGAASSIEGHPTLEPSVRERCIQPEDMGRLVVDVVNTPSHLELLELTVLPTVQEIAPL